MKPSLTATVIVPTSIDRGPLLQYSVGSVLRQTIQDLEILIIGDGAHDVTRDAARELERADSRVRFFDHPKGPRRGEIHRHAVLQNARGRIVCYLCDRDLYLPDHLAEMARLLEGADFAHTFQFRIRETGIALEPGYDLADAAERRAAVAIGYGLSLSFIGHTLEAYRRTAKNWTTTPDGHYTDVYFSSAFLRAADIRTSSGWLPTVLSFHRRAHPGWSTERRRGEIEHWVRRLEAAEEPARLREEVMLLVHRERHMGARLLEHSVLLGGEPISVKTPFVLSRLLLGKLVVYLSKRPSHPLFHPLRRAWLRCKNCGQPPAT